MKWYFSFVNEAQRLRGVVLESLDQEQDANGLARNAYRSRTQFYRLFRAMVEETPVALRRRLLLERAAWQLSRTQLPVTNRPQRQLRIARSVHQGLSKGVPRFTEPLPSDGRYVHSPARDKRNSPLFRKDDTKGTDRSMDLFDIFSGQESWHTRRLLELAKTLNDEQLDRPLKNEMKVFPWDGPDQSLRQILDRMVQTKEVWAAALTGGSMPLLDNAPPETDSFRDAGAHGRSRYSFSWRARGCAQSERLGRHICGRAVRAAGDLYVWRDVRSRDYVQCPQTHVSDGRHAKPGSEGGRFWMSERVCGTLGQCVKQCSSTLLRCGCNFGHIATLVFALPLPLAPNRVF